MARSPLRFWAGEWDTWPIFLSPSSSNHKNIVVLYDKVLSFL